MPVDRGNTSIAYIPKIFHCCLRLCTDHDLHANCHSCSRGSLWLQNPAQLLVCYPAVHQNFFKCPSNNTWVYANNLKAHSSIVTQYTQHKTLWKPHVYALLLLLLLLLQVGNLIAGSHRAYTQHVCSRNCGAYKKSAAYITVALLLFLSTNVATIQRHSTRFIISSASSDLHSSQQSCALKNCVHYNGKSRKH